MQTAWTAPKSDNAFLALDRNNNGTIDDASELFGNLTPQSYSETPHGFIALSDYDHPLNGGNADGLITKEDSIFTKLLLWTDRNHNGTLEANELQRLADSSVRAFSLNFRESRRRDVHGNEFRYYAPVSNTEGRIAWDVFFRLAPDSQTANRISSERFGCPQ